MSFPGRVNRSGKQKPEAPKELGSGAWRVAAEDMEVSWPEARPCRCGSRVLGGQCHVVFGDSS